MNTTKSAKPTLPRRAFIQQVGGLTLAFHLPQSRANLAVADAKAGNGTILEPNAFVRIGSDNKVIVVVKHLEMGQGTHTGLATLLAEELDADWEQVAIEAAPADAKRYNNTFMGPFQLTGGSNSMANSFEQMRHAGAVARAMLVSAAAAQWGVAVGSVTVSKGRVMHAASKRSASFGELAARASKLPVPVDVALKNPGIKNPSGSTVKMLKDLLRSENLVAVDANIPNSCQFAFFHGKHDIIAFFLSSEHFRRIFAICHFDA